MPIVFISRDLAIDSLLMRRFAIKGWSVKSQSMLTFAPLALPNEIPPLDWLFFYSPRGVQFYLHQGGPLPTRLATIGESTAKPLRQLGYEIQFVGKGTPREVAHAFGAIAKGQRVGFVQALHSRKSVENILATQVEAVPIVAYSNTEVSSVYRCKADYYIFTSPRNFQIYHRHFPLTNQDRIVAIGPTTAEAISSAGLNNLRISASPQEEALADCVFSWQEKKS